MKRINTVVVILMIMLCMLFGVYESKEYAWEHREINI